MRSLRTLTLRDHTQRTFSRLPLNPTLRHPSTANSTAPASSSIEEAREKTRVIIPVVTNDSAQQHAVPPIPKPPISVVNRPTVTVRPPASSTLKNLLVALVVISLGYSGYKYVLLRMSPVERQDFLSKHPAIWSIIEPFVESETEKARRLRISEAKEEHETRVVKRKRRKIQPEAQDSPVLVADSNATPSESMVEVSSFASVESLPVPSSEVSAAESDVEQLTPSLIAACEVNNSSPQLDSEEPSYAATSPSDDSISTSPSPLIDTSCRQTESQPFEVSASTDFPVVDDVDDVPLPTLPTPDSHPIQVSRIHEAITSTESQPDSTQPPISVQSSAATPAVSQIGPANLRSAEHLAFQRVTFLVLQLAALNANKQSISGPELQLWSDLLEAVKPVETLMSTQHQSWSQLIQQTHARAAELEKHYQDQLTQAQHRFDQKVDEVVRSSGDLQLTRLAEIEQLRLGLGTLAEQLGAQAELERQSRMALKLDMLSQGYPISIDSTDDHVATVALSIVCLAAPRISVNTHDLSSPLLITLMHEV